MSAMMTDIVRNIAIFRVGTRVYEFPMWRVPVVYRDGCYWASRADVLRFARG